MLACLCYCFQRITRRIVTEIVNVVIKYMFKRGQKRHAQDRKYKKMCIYNNILVDIKDCKTDVMLSFGYKQKMLYIPVPEVFVCQAVSV